MSCNNCNRNMQPRYNNSNYQNASMYRGNQQMRMQREACDSGCNKYEAPVDQMELAMAYVPWQQWDGVNDFEQAINCGTIFPDLYKPWIGRSCEK